MPTKSKTVNDTKHNSNSHPLELGDMKDAGEGDFRGSLVVKTPSVQCTRHRFNPWLGNQDPTCHMVRPKNKKTW